MPKFQVRVMVGNMATTFATRDTLEEAVALVENQKALGCEGRYSIIPAPPNPEDDDDTPAPKGWDVVNTSVP